MITTRLRSQVGVLGPDPSRPGGSIELQANRSRVGVLGAGSIELQAYPSRTGRSIEGGQIDRGRAYSSNLERAIFHMARSKAWSRNKRA
jgi:hypothetical protein